MRSVFILSLVTSHWSLVTGLSGCSKPTASKLQTQQAAVGEQATDRYETTSPGVEQQMQSFTLSGYEPDGTKRWELDGQQASMEGDMVTIHQPDAIGYNTGQTAYLTAQLAHVNRTTRHIQMEDAVVIHTSDGVWLTSPLLHWEPDAQRITTDEPVRIETDRLMVRGRGAIGLSHLKRATLLNDVELVYSLAAETMDPQTASPQRTGHVVITCEGSLTVDDAQALATFERNVHVHDPNGELYSDVLVAYFDRDSRRIRYAQAIGKVRMAKEQHMAWSQRAIYDLAKGTITLTGSSSLVMHPSTVPGRDKKKKITLGEWSGDSNP